VDHESGELSGPVALYDFVYLDYDKVESYSAQLDPAGSLRETKVVKQTVHTAGSAGEVGIPKLASGSASDQTANSESVDRRYDPKLTNALNLFELLSQFGLIEAEPEKAKLHSFVLMKGELSITDVRGLKGIWDIVVDSMIDEQFPPALVDAQLPPSHGRDGAKNREAKAAQRAVQVTRDDVRTKFTRLKVMEQLPHPIQAVMSGNFGASWAALAVEPELVKTIGTGSWRRVVCNYVAAPASAG